MVELSRTGIKSVYIAPRPNNKPPATCIFEYVYFARPDSVMEGRNVSKTVMYQISRTCTGAKIKIGAISRGFQHAKIVYCFRS